MKARLVPSRYLSVFWDERRLGIRLRRARGVHKGKAHFKIVFKGKGKEGKESFFYVSSSE